MDRQKFLVRPKLNSPDVKERLALLREVRLGWGRAPRDCGNVNLHFHSFFSYNSEGWSPTQIACAAWEEGLYAAGLCDFDVLDGLEEFLTAGRILGLRTSVSLETRAYLAPLADKEISSPGEPGITYVMAAGFGRVPEAGTPQAATLTTLREQARARNVAVVGRINAHLPEIAIDYEKDVLPLTPSGNATERHIVRAYASCARALRPQQGALAAFWSQVLGKPVAAVLGLFGDQPALEEAIRSKLVKKGGVGYVQPSPETFPAFGDFMRWAQSCGAVPMATWLDGTSGGEADAQAYLDLMQAQGCQAVNIIPDRNWNLKDPAAAALKQGRLKELVEGAQRRDLPINIGTEMNKLGLPFVDDLNAPVLSAYKDTFQRGARIMVGHTLLARYAGFPYSGPEAAAEFKTVKEKNVFFEAVGALPPLTETTAKRLEDMGPAAALESFRKNARKKRKRTTEDAKD